MNVPDEIFQVFRGLGLKKHDQFGVHWSCWAVERRSSLFLCRGASELLRHARAHFHHKRAPTRSWRAGACVNFTWTLEGRVTVNWRHREATDEKPHQNTIKKLRIQKEVLSKII